MVKEVKPSKALIDNLPLPKKGVDTSILHPFNEIFQKFDKVSVEHYFLMKGKRGRRKKANLEEFGISGGIPSFERCLNINCPSIKVCYDLQHRKLTKVKSCVKLLPKLTKYGKNKHKAELSHRDLCLISLALSRLTISDVASGEDIRLNYLKEVINQLVDTNSAARVIV